MGRNWDQFWQTAEGRRQAIWLAAAMVVVTGLDLLLSGHPKPSSYATMLVVFVGVRWLLRGQDHGRGWGMHRLRVPPARLSRGRAWVVVGLGVSGLALAAGSLLVPDLPERVVSVGMFVAIGLGNLAMGVGSLLPEGRRARAVRLATFPLGVAMLLAMLAWVALQVSDRLS